MKKRKTVQDRADAYANGVYHRVGYWVVPRAGWLAGYRAAQRDARRQRAK